VACLCNFLEYWIKNKHSVPCDDKKEVWLKKLNLVFGFSFIWAFGASFKVSAARVLDNMLRDFFAKLHIPAQETVFEYYFNEKELRYLNWSTVVKAQPFEYDPKMPFFSLLVPTVDTVRYTALLEMLVSINKPVFLTGSTGVGKSIMV
jgi:dynein heavy chain